jgi:hypothetical protein
MLVYARESQVSVRSRMHGISMLSCLAEELVIMLPCNAS